MTTCLVATLYTVNERQWYACGSWNLKTYSYATSDVTIMHDESAVGRLGKKELNVKDKF